MNALEKRFQGRCLRPGENAMQFGVTLFRMPRRGFPKPKQSRRRRSFCFPSLDRARAAAEQHAKQSRARDEARRRIHPPSPPIMTLPELIDFVNERELGDGILRESYNGKRELSETLATKRPVRIRDPVSNYASLIC